MRGFVYRTGRVFADPAEDSHLQPGGKYYRDVAIHRECKDHYNYPPHERCDTLKARVLSRQ